MSRFIKGQLDLALILPTLIGLLYAGTGNWSESRWTTAFLLMGLGPAGKAVAALSYEKGYNTLNPALKRPEDQIQ